MKVLWKLVFCCLVLVLVLLPVEASTQVDWNLDAAGTLTVSGEVAMTDWTSASDAPWYSQKNAIKTVVIQEGVTAIGDYAFRDCTKLTAVTVCDSVTRIGVSAFEGCSSLKTVTLGCGLTQVEDYGFFGCGSLNGVYISDVGAWCGISFADYSSNPLYYAKNLYLNGQLLSGSLQIPEGVTQIPLYGFYYCSGLTAVTLPDSVKTVEGSAFSYCTGLTEVTSGTALTSIGSSAFSYCTALSKVRFGSSLQQIGDYAFRGCQELESAILPDTVKTVGHRAFAECTALEQILLPEGLTQIGTYGFYGCSSLKKVTIPATVTQIGDYTFRGCSNMTELTIGDAVSSIGKHAFYGCSSLKTLTIPQNVTQMGSHAFYSCTGLTQIRFNAVQMQDLSSSNNVFYKAGQSGSGLQVTVGPQVKRIPAYLFFPYISATYGPKLTYVEFLGDCPIIGKYAFAHCTGLQTVLFTGAAPTIGTQAFYKATPTAWHPGWSSDVQQGYGGTVTWVAYEELVEADGVLYPSIEEAAKTGKSLRLCSNARADLTLIADLYVDLNGYDLSGTLVTGGYKIYGMDAATDQYSCQSIGYFSCVDENGQPVVPQAHIAREQKRYIAVNTAQGYSFHRVCLAVTHMTLKPLSSGVGYKAVFYADEMAASVLEGYGFWLCLEGNSPISALKDQGSFQSGKTVTLRLENFDPGRYGETPLYARAVLKLTDGTVLESDTCSMTLRGLFEQLSSGQIVLTAPQQAALAQMIEKFPIIKEWTEEVTNQNS